MEESQKLRLPLIIVAIFLAVVFVVGFRWVLTTTPSTEGAIFYLFDYAVGLTMIFLPCTLPLAFVIVPLAMGKGYARGLGIAVSFALGVTITLSFYGALLGWIGGQFIAEAETAKNIMYMIAGALGLMFALGDIGLTRFRMPTYSGAFPAFIQNQQEFLKAGLLGLFLGNIGVGCPNPLFNGVIVPQILASGGAFQGWIIMLVQALGRVTPLFLLAFLAILGVNATGFLVKHRTKVEKSTGWAMVFVAGFLFTIGAFTHDWYVYSGIHTYLENLTQEEAITNLLGQQVGQLGHTHEVPKLTPALAWGSYIMVTLWLVPFMWLWFRKRREAREAPELEQPAKRASARLWGAFTLTLAAFAYLTFGYVLPHNFLLHTTHGEEAPTFAGRFILEPQNPAPETETTLIVELRDEGGEPLTGLQIEHERLVHVIAVSEDLSYFTHIHPDDFGTITEAMKKNAQFPVKIAFPKAGKYAIAANFLHEGHEGVVKGFVQVGESPESLTLTKDFARTKQVEDITVELKLDAGGLRSGEEAHLEYAMKDSSGKPIEDMTPYLGAPMHVAIWSFDLSYFQHTHGEVPGYGHDVPAGAKFGPLVDVHPMFPYPGLYKVISEFARGSKVYRASFVVEVAPGTDAGNAMMMSAHSH